MLYLELQLDYVEYSRIARIFVLLFANVTTAVYQVMIM